ncbi:hypothetical protein BJ944DRAFT_253299 [Cunninghamella echinulata]|nr:hypothetical protein BJ944DRAFT_253299 [Cunninghamella echinulata]
MSTPAISGVNVQSGSTMILQPTSSSFNLTDVNYSKLFDTPPPTNLPISTPTATPTPTSLESSTTLMTDTATAAPTVNNDNNSDGLTSAQLGGIIGGAAGGLLVILSLICCIVYRRRNRPKPFKRGRGITPSMVIDNTIPTPMTYADKRFDQQSTYSFNSPQNAFGSNSSHYYQQQQQQEKENTYHFTPTSPSLNVTATLDQLYNIKQNNHNHNNHNNHNSNHLELPSSLNPPPPPPLPPSSSSSSSPTSSTSSRKDRAASQVSVNGARLSKYNYLTQAFSQMRASYATQETDQHQQNIKNDPTIQYPTPTYNNNISTYNSIPQPKQQQQQHLTSPSTLNNMNHHYHREISSSSPIPTSSPSPAPSMASSMNAPSITVMNENNEESVLHHGHFINNANISTSNVISTATVSKKLYFPGSTNRDSTISDVSQYSTYSTSSNPFRYSDDQSSVNVSGFESASPQPTSVNNYNNNNISQVARSSPLSEKPYSYI